ncbi:chemotaxis protein CheW [Marinilactibacillus kalidii]|uniref:chemotaxis protein CheW n=1 Tax=Marinilactibacillus kalidii TaxID=2820274 RepID=UPI001ABEDDFF|nr:chemotaxis protein CheW [Marinilactibacillus kalidii]
MNKHILFRVGEQVYAISIADTDRVVHVENYTIVPDVSSYVIGMQDIEGTIVPMIDLSERFFNQRLESYDQSDTVVVNWKEEKVGLTVNEVLSVESYSDEQISEKEQTTQKVDGASTSYISAFVQTKDGIVPILNPHALFSAAQAEEMQALLAINNIQN